MEDIKFKSYCWSLGTTSFRVKNLNFKIEKQLQMLKKLWADNLNSCWSGNELIQSIYYDIMFNDEFITGTAKNKSKDARQKTSGLVELGVIDNERKITDIGNSIIDIVEDNDFTSNNIFNINKDSYIYLKQLLKMEKVNDDFKVKPFIVLLYLLSKLDYLTKEEFTYLLPICTNNEQVYLMVEYIKRLRNNEITIEDIIKEKINSMSNYKAAIDYINKYGINTLEDFALVDMGRKGSTYLTEIYQFYNKLYDIVLRGIDEEATSTIIEFISKENRKNSKVAKYWREYLKFSGKILIVEEYNEDVKEIPIFKIKDKIKYTEEFFKVMHIAKIKATLEDYADLNRRYISLTDIVIFKDNKVELELFPKYYFSNIAEKLLKTEFSKNYTRFLQKEIEIEKIYYCLDVNVDEILVQIKSDYPESDITRTSITTFISDERLKRFNSLLEEKFKNKDLITLFLNMKNNNRKDIIEYTDWEADIPTILEYLIGIIWYKVSNKQGNILNYMKLSLDANLYPKTHAGGGTADIIYEYNNSLDYPVHKLLLEATLTESSNQRRNEMEPVSRHLMREHQENQNYNTYAIFIANFIHEEVASDFRSRKQYTFRINGDITKTGMKIVCLEIEDLINIINKDLKYNVLYKIFDEAYRDTTINDLEWFKLLIKQKIEQI